MHFHFLVFAIAVVTVLFVIFAVTTVGALYVLGERDQVNVFGFTLVGGQDATKVVFFQIFIAGTFPPLIEGLHHGHRSFVE